MKLILCGGGRLGYFLGRDLIARGHRVTVIDDDPEVCDWLARRLRATVVLGDPTEVDLLDEAGAGYSTAEGRSDQLVPHVRHSARLVAKMYLSYALVGTLALRAAGMTWPAAAILVMVGLMIVGGGTGSTAGGIKLFRVYLMARATVWEIRRMLLPGSVVEAHEVWQGDRRHYVTDQDLRATAGVMFLYAVTLMVGTLVLAAHGFSLSDSLFEFASSLGTVGLSIGVTTPDAPALVLWTEAIGMFVGRLEFLVIFAGLAKLARELPSLFARRT